MLIWRAGVTISAGESFIRRAASNSNKSARSGDKHMKQFAALSLSIAILGAIWAYLALGPLSGYVLVWAGFIAWGCYFASGADGKALSKTIAGTCYGAIIGWIALLIIVNGGVPGLGALWAGFC